MADSRHALRSRRRAALRTVSRNVALLSSVMVVIAGVLAWVEPLAFTARVTQVLLLVAGLAWGGYLWARHSGRGRRCTMVSAQGPGGEIIQLATLEGFVRRRGREPPRREATARFVAALRHFRTGSYREAAAGWRRSMESQFNLAAALNLSAGLLNRAEIDGAVRVLKRMLERVDAARDPELAAAVYTNLGAAQARQGRLQEALSDYASADALWAERMDRRGRTDVLVNRAHALAHLGQYAQAGKLCVQALQHYRQLGLRMGRANALTNLGFILAETEESDKALRMQRAALRIHGQIHNPLGEAVAHSHMGHVHFRRDELVLARAEYEEAARLFRRVGEPVGEASALANAGNIRFRQDDLDAALEAYEQALAVHVRSGNILGQAQTLANMGSALLRQRRLGEALERLERARELYASIKVQDRGRRAVERVIRRLERRRRRTRERGQRR